MTLFALTSNSFAFSVSMNDERLWRAWNDRTHRNMVRTTHRNTARWKHHSIFILWLVSTKTSICFCCFAVISTPPSSLCLAISHAPPASLGRWRPVSPSPAARAVALAPPFGASGPPSGLYARGPGPPAQRVSLPRPILFHAATAASPTRVHGVHVWKSVCMLTRKVMQDRQELYSFADRGLPIVGFLSGKTFTRVQPFKFVWCGWATEARALT